MSQSEVWDDFTEISLELLDAERSNDSPRRIAKHLMLALLVAEILSGPLPHAQLSGKGTISGTVTDATGAAVSGASVTAVQHRYRREDHSNDYFEQLLCALADGPWHLHRLGGGATV